MPLTPDLADRETHPEHLAPVRDEERVVHELRRPHPGAVHHHVVLSAQLERN